jgi:hypothetical protein
MVHIGKRKLGVSRAIKLERKKRGKNWDIKGNSNINRGRRLGSISNRDNRNGDNPRFSLHDNTLGEEFSSLKEKRRGHRSSNGNGLNVKKEVREGKANTKSRRGQKKCSEFGVQGLKIDGRRTIVSLGRWTLGDKRVEVSVFRI